MDGLCNGKGTYGQGANFVGTEMVEHLRCSPLMIPPLLNFMNELSIIFIHFESHALIYLHLHFSVLNSALFIILQLENINIII